jgi:hypothetical protein
MPALSEQAWNHPVISGQSLPVRNGRESLCFELQPVGGKNP